MSEVLCLQTLLVEKFLTAAAWRGFRQVFFKWVGLEGLTMRSLAMRCRSTR